MADQAEKPGKAAAPRFGGKQKGAGRPKGAKGKHTKARERAMAKAAAKLAEVLGPNAFDGDAHALLMLVYKDIKQPIELRLDAAGKAIRYEKPALQAIQHTGNVALTHESALKLLAGAA